LFRFQQCCEATYPPRCRTIDARASRAESVGIQILVQPNLTLRCKWCTTA